MKIQQLKVIFAKCSPQQYHHYLVKPKLQLSFLLTLPNKDNFTLPILQRKSYSYLKYLTLYIKYTQEVLFIARFFDREKKAYGKQRKVFVDYHIDFLTRIIWKIANVTD